MFFRKKKSQKVTNDNRIDTTKEGFEYVGIKLTDEQYDKIRDINMFGFLSHESVPAFNVMLLLRDLGLLPKEMLVDGFDELVEKLRTDNHKEYISRLLGGKREDVEKAFPGHLDWVGKEK